MAKKEKDTKSNNKNDFYAGTGRRKRAVARVWLYEEPGDIVVNEKEISEYFRSVPQAEERYLRPLEVTSTKGKVRASIKVQGGGISAQVDAVTLGLARALEELNSDFREPLKQEDLLTRDPREKERKKPYLRKARKAPQYSKR